MEEPQSPTPPDPHIDKEMEQRFLAALSHARTTIEEHGLNPWEPQVGESVAQLADVFDEVLRTGREQLGEAPAGRLVVLDAEISLKDLQELAAGDPDEPIAIPPSLLLRLLDMAAPTGTAEPPTPATVDVFVEGVRCRPAAGRSQGGSSRWLEVDLPGKGVLELLVKAKAQPEGAGNA